MRFSMIVKQKTYFNPIDNLSYLDHIIFNLKLIIFIILFLIVKKFLPVEVTFKTLPPLDNNFPLTNFVPAW